MYSDFFIWYLSISLSQKKSTNLTFKTNLGWIIYLYIICRDKVNKIKYRIFLTSNYQFQIKISNHIVKSMSPFLITSIIYLYIALFFAFLSMSILFIPMTSTIEYLDSNEKTVYFLNTTRHIEPHSEDVGSGRPGIVKQMRLFLS